MVTRFYLFAWLLTAGLAALLYFTGNVGDLTPTIFGFVFATLAFMGIVAVLPWWVDREYTWRY